MAVAMSADKKLSSIDEKFKKDELKFGLITNDDLVCRDCRNRFVSKMKECLATHLSVPSMK